jgi:hypothetical protein
LLSRERFLVGPPERSRSSNGPKIPACAAFVTSLKDRPFHGLEKRKAALLLAVGTAVAPVGVQLGAVLLPPQATEVSERGLGFEPALPRDIDAGVDLPTKEG